MLGTYIPVVIGIGTRFRNIVMSDTSWDCHAKEVRGCAALAH